MPELSIVVPVYRSAATLSELYRRISATLDEHGVSFELILVDDDSPDESWAIACGIQADDEERVTAIRLMRNFGQHNAIMCGLRHARGDLIVTMDDDLQNPPEEIPRLKARLREGDFDLVYGAYRRGKRHLAWRNAGSRVVNSFFRLVFRTGVNVSSFRIMRRELAECVFSYDLNFTFLDGLLAWNTNRIEAIEVEHQARRVGASGYSLGRLALLGMNLVTNFSLLPLQVVSAMGMLFSAVGLSLGAYYLGLFALQRIVVPGYASTIVAILILGGVQLLALGVIGEYLGRLHLNVNRKPQYTIRSVEPATRTMAQAAAMDGDAHD